MTDHTQDSAGQSASLGWRQPVSIVALSFKIYLLRLLTLGIYHFWGKTEVRRKLWSAVHIDEQPVEYTGRGKELFLGFLIAFFVVILPILLAFEALPFIGLYIAQSFPELGQPAVLAVIGVGQLILFLLIFYFVGVARYRARRYRLSRSRWRGIRGGMTGSSWGYGWTYLWTMLLLPFTLGWLTPWRNVKLQRRLTSETRFGDESLGFDGQAGPLYKPFALMWLGALIVIPGALGLIYLLFGAQLQNVIPNPELAPQLAPDGGTAMMFVQIFAIYMIATLLLVLFGAWYASKEFNYFARSTQLHDARFDLATTPVGLIWLIIGNVLIGFGVFLLATLVLGLIAAGLFMAGGGPEFVMQMQMQQQMAPGAPPNFGALSPLMLFMPLIVIMWLLSGTLASPFIAVRTVRHFISRMGIDGAIDFDRIAQSQQRLDSTGEGLAEAFDIDGF